MIYNSYYTNIVTRLLFLLLSMAGLSFLFVTTDRFFTMLFLAVLILLQVSGLFHFLNQTNRNLARFLLLLTTEDTSVTAWKDKVERSFKGLHHSFRKVNQEINRIRLEKEKGTIMMNNLINQLNSGIMATDESGHVVVINSAALGILGISELGHLKELDRIQDGMAARLEAIRYDSGNVITFISDDHESISLLVKVSLFRLEEQMIRVYSIHNIGSQLEAKEIESWQKMTRVLSHEISNSVTPIATLGSGIQIKLSRMDSEKDGSVKMEADVAGDLVQSAGLLRKKCDALVEFVDHYKRFARIPDPAPEEIDLCEFLPHIQDYFVRDLEDESLSLSVAVPDHPLRIQADRGLLDLVLVNLVRNSLEALKEKGKGDIRVTASRTDTGKILLEVNDNGPGICEEIRPQIFVPFFTTKPQGTGIGLSIVKKIVLMMGGSIHFESIPDTMTSFYLYFSQHKQTE